LLELFKVGLLFALLVTVGRLSPVFTCLAVGIAFFAHMIACLIVVRRVDGIPLRELFSSLLPATVSCVVMAAGVVGVRWTLAASGPHRAIVGLLLETLGGVIAYLTAALVVARGPSEELVQRLRDALARAAG
jgi:hypothetical protein